MLPPGGQKNSATAAYLKWNLILKVHSAPVCASLQPKKNANIWDAENDLSQIRRGLKTEQLRQKNKTKNKTHVSLHLSPKWTENGHSSWRSENQPRFMFPQEPKQVIRLPNFVSCEARHHALHPLQLCLLWPKCVLCRLMCPHRLPLPVTSTDPLLLRERATLHLNLTRLMENAGPWKAVFSGYMNPLGVNQPYANWHGWGWMANVDCNIGPWTKSPPAGSHTSTRTEQTFRLLLTQGQTPLPNHTHTHTHWH